MEESAKKTNRRIILCTLGILLCLALIGFCLFWMYRRDRTVILPPEDFAVETPTQNLTLAAVHWLDAYLAQYQVIYLPPSRRAKSWEIQDVKELENGEYLAVLCEFTVAPKAGDLGVFEEWGIAGEEEVFCQWVLWFEKTGREEEGFRYRLIRRETPAAYELGAYQGSEQQAQDDYHHEFKEELPYEQSQYTYKIQEETCSVSLDGGTSWREVPIALETLCSVGDGNAYYNRLQQGSYLISPQRTALVYGGTLQTGLSIITSGDGGKSWKTALIDGRMDSVRVKFVSFPTPEIGYVIATGGRTMSQEGQVVYRTADGGETWVRMGQGPSTWLLQSAGFVSETVGFMCYSDVEGARGFYRTEDEGRNYTPVDIPLKDEWKKIFVSPQCPTVEDGRLVMLIGQGDSGDFQGGRVMAKYMSEDMGLTWSFVELYEPPSNDPG